MADPALEPRCSNEGCDNPARLAIHTVRSNAGYLRVTLHMDDRTAPKAAMPYCKPCGRKLAGDLVEMLVST